MSSIEQVWYFETFYLEMQAMIQARFSNEIFKINSSLTIRYNFWNEIEIFILLYTLKKYDPFHEKKG